jgi:hypothetical protein
MVSLLREALRHDYDYSRKKAAILDTLIQSAKNEGAISSLQSDDYHIGETMGWYRILSIVIDESEAYSVPLSELGLASYNPDDLLSVNKAKQAA